MRRKKIKRTDTYAWNTDRYANMSRSLNNFLNKGRLDCKNLRIIQWKPLYFLLAYADKKLRILRICLKDQQCAQEISTQDNG